MTVRAKAKQQDMTAYLNKPACQAEKYTSLRDAYASMTAEMLQAYPWEWFVSLTSKKPMPLTIIRGRFFWWLKILRRALHRHVEVIWFIERQRRGALHVHAVIHGVPIDKTFWQGMVNTWEKYSTRENEKFGDADIKRFRPERAGKLSWYLAKERCKDLHALEGNGFLSEMMGYSRGVRQFLAIPEEIRPLIYRPSSHAPSLCDAGDILRD